MEEAGVNAGGGALETAAGVDAGIKAGGGPLTAVVTAGGAVPVDFRKAGASLNAGADTGRGIEYISGAGASAGIPILPKILACTGASVGISGGTGGVAVFSDSSSFWLRFHRSSVVVLLLLSSSICSC